MSRSIIQIIIGIMMVLMLTNTVIAAGSVTFNSQSVNGSVNVADVNYDGGDYVVVIEDTNGDVWGHSSNLSSNKTDLSISLNQNVSDDIELTAGLYQTSSSSDFGSSLGISDSAIVSPDGDSGGGGGIITGSMDKDIILLVLLALVVLIFVGRR